MKEEAGVRGREEVTAGDGDLRSGGRDATGGRRGVRCVEAGT